MWLCMLNAAVSALRERNLRLSAQDVDELFAVADRSATFLAGLVDDLLDSSRLVAGGGRPVVRPVNSDDGRPLGLRGKLHPGSDHQPRLVRQESGNHLLPCRAQSGISTTMAVQKWNICARGCAAAA